MERLFDFDFKIIIWVVVLIVYAVRQFMKLTSIKSTQKEAPVPSAPYSPKQSGELVKKQTVQNRAQKPLHEREIIDKKVEAWSKPKFNSSSQSNRSAQEEVRRSSKSLEISDYDDNIVTELSLAKQAQEEMHAKALRQKVSNPNMVNARFEPYALQHAHASYIGEKLKSPQSLREAIVLGEILNRKY